MSYLTRCLSPVRPTSRVRLMEAIRDFGLSLSPGLEIGKSYGEATPAQKNEILDWLDTCEWFDFGRANPDDIREASKEAIPFVKARLIRMPFPRCAFRVRMVVNAEKLLRDDEDKPLNDIGQKLSDFYKADETIEAETVLLVEQDEDDMWNLTIQIVRVAEADGSFITVVAASDDPDEKTRRMTLWPMMGLWLMLNTKNINRRVDVPSVKLNRARAKQGRSPLKTVTHIDASHYFTALRETRRYEADSKNTGGGNNPPGNSRVSPRMHLRRAHLRHLSTGKVTIIHAMIINAVEGSNLKREAYKLAP